MWCGFWIVSYHGTQHKNFFNISFFWPTYLTFHSFSPQWPLLRYSIVCFWRKTKEVRQRNPNKNINIRERERDRVNRSVFFLYFFLIFLKFFLSSSFRQISCPQIFACIWYNTQTHTQTHARILIIVNI